VLVILLLICIVGAVIGGTFLSWKRQKDFKLKTQALGEQEEKELSAFYSILDCFTVQNTMQRLFSSRKYADEDPEFEIFNSIKVLSIALIVFGNTFLFIFTGPIMNLD